MHLHTNGFNKKKKTWFFFRILSKFIYSRKFPCTQICCNLWCKHIQWILMSFYMLVHSWKFKHFQQLHVFLQIIYFPWFHEISAFECILCNFMRFLLFRVFYKISRIHCIFINFMHIHAFSHILTHFLYFHIFSTSFSCIRCIFIHFNAS